MAVHSEVPALLSCSLASLVVRLEAPLAVGFVEAPLVAAFGAQLSLAAAGGFLDSALAFFAGLSSFPASPQSGLAGCSAFAFFLRYFSVALRADTQNTNDSNKT
jgi:hypothetical protein